MHREHGETEVSPSAFHSVVSAPLAYRSYKAPGGGAAKCLLQAQSLSNIKQSLERRGNGSEGKHTQDQPTRLILHFVGKGLLLRIFKARLRMSGRGESESHISSLVSEQ